MVYRSEDDEPRDESEVSEQEKARARQAWHVFHEWRTIPGLADDGSIDEAALDIWIDETSAITPLPAGKMKGVPDTYPFGV